MFTKNDEKYFFYYFSAYLQVELTSSLAETFQKYYQILTFISYYE